MGVARSARSENRYNAVTGGLRAIAVLSTLMCALVPARGEDFAQRFAACLACHAEDAQSSPPNVPSLGGQPSYYIAFQLYLFREGQRRNDVMDGVAKGITDDDLRLFADAVSKLAPPKPAAAATETTRLARGRTIAAEQHCDGCHQPDFSGQNQNPRLAGQREDYLAQSLRDYKSGVRIGYRAAMAEAVHGLGETDFVALAYFLAHLP